MDKQTAQIVKTLLAKQKKIVVVGHRNPDGDAVGSSLGLAYFLKELNHKVNVIMPNDFPDFLKWMPGASEITIHEQETAKSKQLIEDADVIFTLDFNALNRTGEMEEALAASDAKFVMIDHHQQPEDYAVAVYSDAMMSSTSEMVYHFIEALHGIDKLSSEISTNLYTGIMTDTGSFRFPLTTATTHRIIANLLENGANNSFIHESVYDTNSPDKLRLLGVALENLEVLSEYNTAYITLSQKELDDHNFKKGDTEGFVNYALSVEGIVFATIFIENKAEKITKISFRSKGDFSVNEFARAHFNGGGHNNAAGGRSNDSLKDTVTKFISILPDYKTALTSA